MTVAIVVVSHSPALAEAAVELAREMIPSNPPAIAVAAGAGAGIIGTDAVAIAAAIDRVTGPDGTIVVMDLGSAILSAELALEFMSTSRELVRLSAAPFVEGLIAAVVRASGGASLDEVAAEAELALSPKVNQLSATPVAAGASGASAQPAAANPATPLAHASAAQPDAVTIAAPPTVSARVVLRNPSGLHARPAAAVATEAAGWNAEILLSNITQNRGPVPADSSIMIMTLGAGPDDEVEIAATGRDAKEAVASLSAMMRAGFGEL